MTSDDDPFGDDNQRTVVDTSFFSQAEVPNYPTLARFGRFEILGRIARGGMAEVYLARERDEEGDLRHLVVKRILPEMEGNADLLRMFLEEGATAVRLYHPNVCHVYECGEVDGITFMALEWVWGTSLEETIKESQRERRQIPWTVGVGIVMQVAAALEYVHHARGVGGRPLNIVHRDVSPQNIMLTWEGAVKLLDFGIAKTSHEKAPNEGGFVGKYSYMSPEQAEARPVDLRSDVFALGIVLYETLTGRPLFDRPNFLDVLNAVVYQATPSMLEANPELPPELQPIVERALAKDPAHRFQTAGEMRDALAAVIQQRQQMFNEQRVKIFLRTLFPADRRVPLGSGSHKLTGAFNALTAEGAAAIAGENDYVSLHTFDHAAPSSHPPVPAAPTSSPEQPAVAAPRSGYSFLFWAAMVLLGVLMLGAGAGVAFLVLG